VTVSLGEKSLWQQPKVTFDKTVGKVNCQQKVD